MNIKIDSINVNNLKILLIIILCNSNNIRIRLGHRTHPPIWIIILFICKYLKFFYLKLAKVIRWNFKLHCDRS